MGREFLANTGTATAARDMDLVRQALGEAQINYLGFSYGSELGTAYAEAFPQNVRAMVFDGATDPTQETVEANVRQMEMIGGQADVLAIGIREWFDGLWHGRRLAYTVATIAVVGSFCYWWVATRLAETEDGSL